MYSHENQLKRLALKGSERMKTLAAQVANPSRHMHACRQTDERSNEWMDGRMDGWMDGRTDGWMDGWMDGRTDGWMSE